MKVYNKDKTQILEEYDLEKGHLKEDTITIHYDEVQAVEEQGHYVIIAEYPNGGKEVEWIVDVKGIEYQPERDVEEEIQVYIPYTNEELLENKKNSLRNKRTSECFPIINRGELWYDNLTQRQFEELEKWYNDWLNVTETLEEPIKPSWIK